MTQHIGELIQGGGAVALAVLVWWELRLFRREVGGTMQRIAERQATLLERQQTIADHVKVKKRLTSPPALVPNPPPPA